MRYSGAVVEIEEMPLTSLVQLVNGWGSIPRAEAGEQDLLFPDVADVTDGLGLRPARSRVRDRELVDVADRLHPVFASPDPAKRVRLVADLLGQTGVRPVLAVENEEVRSMWAVARRADAVLAAASVALRSFLAWHDATRLGVCSGLRCADVYVDASPTGLRRFCSLTCQNRARVAAFRRRGARR
jgi:CGNR zinc finger